MMEGSTFPAANPNFTPLRNSKDKPIYYLFIDTVQSAKPGDSHGRLCTGNNGM